jgi:hypothetical protein
MSSGSRFSPVIEFPSNLLESQSTGAMRSTEATAVLCPPVLLVGRSGSWGTPALKSLEKFGAQSVIVSPQTATPEYVMEKRFAIILLDSTVSRDVRKRLASGLAGTSVSIFYTFPVENGCWWLPTLRRGRECHGAPAFRRNEFSVELERMLQE